MTEAGLSVQEWQTTGHPTLFAEHCKAGSDQPTCLFYGHYDVQPTDPIQEWSFDPFIPEQRDGEIFARGASDDKGQTFFLLKAIQDLIEHDELPINVKIIIEGEEEIGSTGLSGILLEKQDKLQADYLAVVDLSIPSIEKPAVTLGTRGIVAMSVTFTGSSHDLHSGQLGGMVFNPLHALVQVLSSMRNPDGSIAVDGFYDGIKKICEEERDQLDFSFDEKEFYDLFQALPTGGEQEFSPVERVSLRPTLEINGIKGGYGGEGFKTVIPAKALAKISCRLVPGQDPEWVAKKVKEHILLHTPEGITAEVNILEGHGKAAFASPSSPPAKAFAAAYEKVFQAPCRFLLQGGSIPITAELAHVSGAEPVMIGVGLPDDQIHAPNEHFGVKRLELGYLLITEGLKQMRKNS